MATSTPFSNVSLIIPMKPLVNAKMRLSPIVDDLTRQAVALAMFDHVCSVAIQAFRAGDCRVVGGDALVEEISQNHGLQFCEDRGHDLNSSISLAIMDAWDTDSKGVLVIPADVPMVSKSDLVDLIGATDDLKSPVGTMAMSDGGTNAMFWPIGVNFPPSFGEHSFSRFKAFTSAEGKPLISVSAAGLAFDVDTPEDLNYAQSNIPNFTEKLAEFKGIVNHWISLNPVKAAWEIALEEEELTSD
ncbi:MAG: 2-phospho-L-lactate guanylyltransferase [Chloroflexi bacterium]|nr:2-phospho-L-lactate guanylyltransferase [Chloroflexota bacterium]MBT18247.1 2-phospho-L-lactate guanylyltransferase [Dehalococcoidia bacterium]